MRSIQETAIPRTAQDLNRQMFDRVGRENFLNGASTPDLMAEVPRGMAGRQGRFFTRLTQLTNDLLGGVVRNDKRTPYPHHPFSATNRAKDDGLPERELIKILV